MESPFEIQKFVREVRFGDYDSFFRRLQSFFANTTYEVIREQELHYENVLFIVFKLVGFYTQVEYHTSKGRIDLVLQTDKLIYVMEFKLTARPRRLCNRFMTSITRFPLLRTDGSSFK